VENCPEHAVNLMLLSLAGIPVFRDRLPVTGTTCTKTINLPATLSKGLYLLVVQGERSVRYEKILLR
jgi:hypothetical protein